MKEYIQLPPIEKNTSSEEVRVIWEYARMTPEARKAIDVQNGIIRDSTDKIETDQLRETVKNIPEEDLKGFNETMRDILAQYMIQACHFTSLVFKEIFINEKDIQDLMDEYPEHQQYIYTIYILLLKEEAGGDEDPQMMS